MNAPTLPMPLPPGLGPLRERACRRSEAERLDELAHDCPCSASAALECMALDCAIRRAFRELYG